VKRRATWLAALLVAFVPVITNMVGMAPSQPPKPIVVVHEPDVSLTHTRLSSTDIPRSHPLWAPERNAVRVG
jgi:hypothetical protein